MKLKSTAYYWLAVIFGGVGMGTAMGAEGTAQTTGYISSTLFAVSLVLILVAVLLARLGFAAEDMERAAKRRKYGQAQRVMSLAAHHHKNNIKQEVLQVALLRIYDVEQEPPALVSQQQFPVTSDAIVIADELAKRKPERLYRVFDADMNVVYAR